jgi:hypothetical protein
LERIVYNINASVEGKVLTITIDLSAEPRKGSLIASTEGEVQMRDSGLRLQLYLYKLVGAKKYLRK